MAPLEPPLRKKLENAIVAAREVAEEAADIALKRLAVDKGETHSALSGKERELRRHLCAKMGQMRDFDELRDEVAYEHWHRMLFARFLAENNLLVHPGEGVPVTLEECEELAASGAGSDKWDVAAKYATGMLPQIFRVDSPVFQITLAPEHQQELERLLESIPTEIFFASDSLGWVYQYWQSKRKEEVNRSEVKIGARELPAVTQLFTEPYMVSFLLDNSLGAWWAARRLMETDLKTAKTEVELRAKASFPGVPLTYLRFVQNEEGVWSPAAGTFDAWPKHLGELKVLDPCCGSGHFLVAALLMLAPMRMAMEGLSAREAVDAVLKDNLHGLDIDSRVVEIAAFALAFTAWRFPGAKGFRSLPRFQVACSGKALRAKRETWEKLANGNHNLRIALGLLYDQFKDAPVLGSLLHPAASPFAGLAGWENTRVALGRALAKERDEIEYEAGIIAQGIAEAGAMLSQSYHLVLTNVPYLSRSKQIDALRNHCAEEHNASKNDIATVFLDRWLDGCEAGGTCCMVLPQNWLFLSSYRKLREHLLQEDTWHLIARLGPQAFQTPMFDYNIQLLTLSRGEPLSIREQFLKNNSYDNLIHGLDVSELRDATEKASHLATVRLSHVSQLKQLENPDAVISFNTKITDDRLLKEHAQTFQGIGTSDNSQFLLDFWEILKVRNDEWRWVHTAASSSKFINGCSAILLWEHGVGRYYRHAMELKKAGRLGGWKSGGEAWGKTGFIINVTNYPVVNRYLGDMFDTTVAVMIMDEVSQVAIYAYICSENYVKDLRSVDQSLSALFHNFGDVFLSSNNHPVL